MARSSDFPRRWPEGQGPKIVMNAFSYEALENFLRIPEGHHIIGLENNVARRTVRFLVTGDTLGVVPEGQEAPEVIFPQQLIVIDNRPNELNEA